jgi:hypothetical protein
MVLKEEAHPFTILGRKNIRGKSKRGFASLFNSLPLSFPRRGG